MANSTKYQADCPCLGKSELEIIKALSAKVCDFYNDSLPLCTDVYGYSCKSHNLDVLPDCTAEDGREVPDICHQEWCYVNETACFSSNNTHFQQELAEDLFFSYSTCASSTSTSRFEPTPENSVKGKILQASIPGEEFPYFYKEERNSTLYKGAIIDYLQILMDTTEMSGFNIRLKSGGAKKHYNTSSYTAAVMDVANGLSDIAVGPIWITSERLREVNYAVPYHSSTLYLFELEEKGMVGTFYQNANKSLAPFETELWVVSLSLVFFVGLMKVYLANARGNTNSWYLAFRSHAWKSSSRKRRIYIATQVIIEALADTFVEYWGQGTSLSKGSTLGSKIMMLGFGFFTLILTASYVANLSSFLTVQHTDHYVVDMMDAIDKNKKICAQIELIEIINSNEAWHNANMEYMYGENQGYLISAAKKLQSGECDLFIAEDTQIDTIPLGEMRNEFCSLNIISLKNPVTTIDWAFPIQVQYSAAISKAILSKSLEGLNFRNHIAAHIAPCDCGVYIMNEEISNSQISYDQMTLPFTFLFITMTIATVMKIFKVRTKHFGNYRTWNEKDEMEGIGLPHDNTSTSAGQTDSNDHSYELLEYKYRLELITFGINKIQNDIDTTITKENISLKLA